MVQLLVSVTLATFVVVGYLYWAERSLRPPLLLAAGMVAALAQPLWARLFESVPDMPGRVIRLSRLGEVPFWTVIGGGVLLAVPPLVVAYGLRHRWWSQHYAAAWGFFLSFIFFFLVVNSVELRSGNTLFALPQLPRDGFLEALFHSMLLASISFGLLYAFVSTRHYALQIALAPLLISGLAASALLVGILSSPLWVARRLSESDRVALVGATVSVVLVLWAIHLLANGLHAGRRQRLQWR